MAFDRFRNQFVLGPEPASRFPDGSIVRLSERWCLTTHPDLSVIVREGDHGRLALVGFMLDPHRPDASDEDVLDALLPRLCPAEPSALLPDEDYSATYPLGGRWVLVIERFGPGAETALLHDAAGLRQVYHATDGDPRDGAVGAIWCASTAGMISGELGLQNDDRACDFMSLYAAEEDESWWPGTSSPYAGVQRLLPNHVLSLETGKTTRFWPVKPRVRMRPRQALTRIGPILEGTMRSADSRFDLVLGMTAGWDSRVVLAAARSVADRLRFVTVRQARMAEDDEDVTLSGRLLDALGLPHRVVDATTPLDELPEAFRYAYLDNVDFPHRKWAPDVAALSEAFPERPVAVSGGFAEAARNFYGTVPGSGGPVIDAAYLLAAAHMPSHAFAEQQLREWLSGVPDTLGYSVLDLFYWEQRTGSWLAMCQAEFDPAWGDILTPYNSRELMTTFLAVDKRHRKGPWYLLHRHLIEMLWPELLKTPINPGSHPVGLVRRAAVWLKAFASFHAPDALKARLGRG